MKNLPNNVNLAGFHLATLLGLEMNGESRAQMARLTDTEWQQVVELAQAQMVAALLYARIQQHELVAHVPDSPLKRLEKAQYQTALCNLRLYHQLRHILALANAQQIPILLLKGAHLAAAVYPTMEQRSMSDLDLLVRVDDIPAMVDLLQGLGYRPAKPLDGYENPMAIEMHHLPRFVKAHAPTIEIHWRLNRTNDRQHFDIEALWSRAIPLSIQGEEALGLAAEDLLIHVAMHATHRHILRQGVRFLCDIDAIVYRYHTSQHASEGMQLDWATVVERARACDCSRGLSLALTVAAQLFETPLPVPIVQMLKATPIPIEIRELALSQLFLQERQLLRIMNPNAQRLHSQRYISGQLRYLWKRLFLPRRQLAVNYHIPAHSSGIYLFYLLRFKDLISKHLITQQRALRAHPKARHYVKEQKILVQWLGANS